MQTNNEAFRGWVMSLEHIAAAIDRQDYKTAAQLLRAWIARSPDEPWGQFYRARLLEAGGQLDTAKSIYQTLLKTVTYPKLVAHTRQAIRRIEVCEQIQHEQMIREATANPQHAEPGLLILEAINPENRSIAAQTLARVFKLDAYTARLHLHNRGWRLYRRGAIGELNLYGQQLQSGNVSAFWTSDRALQAIPVFEVQSVLHDQPQAVVVCRNEAGQLGSLTFDWSEISQQVRGQLPIFEQVIESTMRQGVQRQRKEQTQDYVQLCDLHLPTRPCILRFCDWRYQFDQGIQFSASNPMQTDIDHSINRFHWNELMNFLSDRASQKTIWSDFAPFAETAIDFPGLLDRIPAKITSFGQDSNLWNSAFQLYSTLAFVRRSV